MTILPQNELPSARLPDAPSSVPAETLCAAEAAAHAGLSTTSVALLASHLLRDGELVLLILRPSRWFMLLSSLKFLAIIAIFTSAAIILDGGGRAHAARYIELGLVFAAGRIMWAIVQWMGRLYILTNLRILRFSGVFNIEVFDCALRKVARVLLEATIKERLFRIGSIIIIPQDEEQPVGVWQIVAHPQRVHDTIQATIARAKQGS